VRRIEHGEYADDRQADDRRRDNRCQCECVEYDGADGCERDDRHGFERRWGSSKRRYARDTRCHSNSDGYGGSWR
jgi:hypothetical protein